MTTRLDKAISERFGLSRRASQEAIRNGRVDLEGERCDEPGRLIGPDSNLGFDPNRPKVRRVARSGLKVLHEDAEVLVVDKPSGLLSLPTAAHEPDTLSGRVERYLTIRHGRRPFVGVVHRLDRETSGALAFAKTPGALRALQEMFKNRAVERRYLAVVEGAVGREAGVIDLELAPDEGDRRRAVSRVPGSGIPARTRYRVVERFGPVASLLACWLETGRTHQVRLHLAAIGHPVVGDPLYRPPGRPRSKAKFDRQALHAQTLGFRHPTTGREVSVECAPPADYAALLTDLRNRFGVPNPGG